MKSITIPAQFIRTKFPAPEYTVKYSPKYAASGDFGLVDVDVQDGVWQAEWEILDCDFGEWKLDFECFEVWKKFHGYFFSYWV